MRIIFSIALIITLLPVSVFAHGGEGAEAGAVFQQEAGVLPGEACYFVDLLGEWFELNIFTPSTKQKQRKLVEFAEERVAELVVLSGRSATERSAYTSALSGYQKTLLRAEDMAEKILILDGAEIALAENFEAVTQRQEQVLHNLLGSIRFEFQGIIREAASTARIENQKMFEYMVVNYQFTDEDVEKHGNVVREHMEFILFEIMEEDLVLTRQQQARVESNLEEAAKFLDAGLNIEAYEYVNRAKDSLYSQLRD